MFLKKVPKKMQRTPFYTYRISTHYLSAQTVSTSCLPVEGQGCAHDPWSNQGLFSIFHHTSTSMTSLITSYAYRPKKKACLWERDTATKSKPQAMFNIFLQQEREREREREREIEEPHYWIAYSNKLWATSCPVFSWQGHETRGTLKLLC